MARYVAFLRGVSPMNLSMTDLKRCLEQAGFTAVKTLLSSGNVAFDARNTSVARVEERIEAALDQHVGRSFHAIVRSAPELQALLALNPYAAFDLPAEAKRVVTFSRRPLEPVRPLPRERDGARLLTVVGREAFSAYVPTSRGPVFMALIESTLGTDVTTRTWDTVKRCAAA